MDTQILSKSAERSDAPVLQQYSSSRSSVARSPRPSRASLAGSSGGGGSDGGSGGGNIVLHQPMQRLSRYLGLLNRTCGAALVLTGGWAAFDALRSFDWPEVLGAVLLSVYVGGSGAMLLRYELAGDRSARDVAFRRDYGFLYSHAGRTGFLLLCANLAWACAPCPVSPYISLYLPISPYISPYLPNQARPSACRACSTSLYLPISPYISLYLPISPYISL